MYSYFSNTNHVITIDLVFLIKLIDELCLNARISGNYLDPNFSYIVISPHKYLRSFCTEMYFLLLCTFIVCYLSESILLSGVDHALNYIKCSFFPRSNYYNSLIMFGHLPPSPSVCIDMSYGRTPHLHMSGYSLPSTLF